MFVPDSYFSSFFRKKKRNEKKAVEYINRQELMKERERAITVYENANIFSVRAIREGMKPLLNKIVDLPSVDVVEVVRCKNCNYSQPTSAVEGCYCCMLTSGLPQFVKPDEFCSRGSTKDTHILNSVKGVRVCQQ